MVTTAARLVTIEESVSLVVLLDGLRWVSSLETAGQIATSATPEICQNRTKWVQRDVGNLCVWIVVILGTSLILGVPRVLGKCPDFSGGWEASPLTEGSSN